MDKFWLVTKIIPNSKNKEVIEEFLLSLKLANRSRGTVIIYRRFLERFFYDMTEPFHKLTADQILQWFLKNEANVKEVTYRMRLSVLSSFYTFCVQERYLEKSPIKSRWFPRVPKSMPKYLEKEEIAKMRVQGEVTSLRNQVVVEFMLTTGCRVGEVHLLNKEDLDLENRTARVKGKGKKIRTVHFTEKCAVLLEKYLNLWRPRRSPAVFVTRMGTRLSIRMIQVLIRDVGKDAELTSRLHPHRLRHTFATELLAKGAELSFIGDELGHSDIGTTQIYAKLPKREIISLYRKYMG
ncbi:tyrosine-type recombinase/integrase [Metabacillus halosaccharovorans]|uniref:tyrosine-type recombinase/integrase n=1 Tax=Metabacillus halosaccharovorans TaxID=930124 RepID=UPI001C1F393F|nr:tyrosine-type recombinase/integrase [Metabacillus halosaccharovorans]MBU7595724.1 tyrosine-type recombinase/integrase [Metabacillus halosaccharovorans]